LDADFTFYGGIYRDVELISLPKQHFSLNDFASDGFYVDYKNVSQAYATIQITALLDNDATTNKNAFLDIQLFDQNNKVVKFYTEKLDLPALASNKYVITLPEISGPQLWSPDNPYLYTLKLTLSENGIILDTKTSPIGFRWFNVDPNKGLFLNGKPLKLIGVNHHQDYQGLGNAVPVNLQLEDIDIIKNMGANVIRIAHYPQTREIYKMCDELGLLVWTEIPIVNKVTDSKAFFDTSLNMQKEHIKQYINHPSVVMIGYMNEIFLRMAFDNKASEEEKEQLKKVTLDLAKQLEGLTRELAPNHITVMAGHLNEVYNETGIADLPMLFGWNLYFGWYDKDIPDLGVFLDEQYQRYPNRCLFLSEYGPGADVRIFTRTPKKFDYSLEYQSKLHRSYFQQIVARPYMTGMTAWNFADFGSEFRGDAIPHVNQKGLVQYDRTPKEVYYWYKSVLDKKDQIIHIATDFLSELTLFGNATYPVEIFSNQDKITVTLNDEEFGEFKVENGIVTLELPFKNGNNVIKVISNSIEDEKALDVLKIDYLDFKTFNRFGINVGSHFYFVDKEHQITWVPDQPYQRGLFGYMDGNVFNLSKDKHQGIPYNIKNTTSEPLFQTMLEDCTTYKVDIPKGDYKVNLFFVEPQAKRVFDVYSLKANDDSDEDQSKRIFDVYLNNKLLQSHFDLASEFPEKYGITKTGMISILDENGLTINLKPIKGKPVISGILIEKID